MSVADHATPIKARVKIMTVDPSTRRVEGVMKDGSMIQIAVWDVGNAFRWPKENEVWLVRREGTVWVLCNRQQEAKDPSVQPVTSMQPGQMILDSGSVIDINGHTFVAVDLTGIQDGWSLKWSATLKRFIAGP